MLRAFQKEKGSSMSTSTALKNDDMVVLDYDHEKRQISIEGGDPITINEAKTLFERALVADCNMAMTTLCNHDYDMDAVERYYNECDGAA